MTILRRTNKNKGWLRDSVRTNGHGCTSRRRQPNIEQACPRFVTLLAKLVGGKAEVDGLQALVSRSPQSIRHSFTPIPIGSSGDPRVGRRTPGDPPAPCKSMAAE